MLKSLKQKAKYLAFLGLTTNATLTAVENEIPHISNLVKNTDPKEKTSDIESKYFKATDYNKLTSQPLDAKNQLINLLLLDS